MLQTSRRGKPGNADAFKIAISSKWISARLLLLIPPGEHDLNPPQTDDLFTTRSRFTLLRRGAVPDSSQTRRHLSPGGIQFGGSGWDNYNPGHAAERYKGSYTVTNAPDATIVLFFRGKSIKYYGDKDPKGGSASVRIDGQAAATVGVVAPPSGFLFQQMLWASPPLDSNDHQIVISNVGAKVNPQQGLIGLDFFEIVPNDGTNSVAPSSFGPGASSVPKNAILVDDSEGSITYSGTWQTKNSIPDSSIYFRGSAHTTQSPGDSCTFRFIGTDIWYFTDYAPGNAVIGISIDGGAPESVNTAAASPVLS
ncbi:hypothetical protein FRC06_005228, partial [Ceratobasidium sp. 370]